ncbi:hypothetical protein L596_011079 [Steinernema carpocapsae]|uniref:Serine/threonine-protein kinase PLK n=1 Tax=Steinernema carpocapsae TaxID=34508 RepID=A0A4V6A4C5_STECR|nr:hypothetical protein L596_011079 [Steinernema carpocapsae]
MSSSKISSNLLSGDVVDRESRTVYKVGRFLGKGGFARCYELIKREGPMLTDHVAGKVISKNNLTKKNSREKISQEIDIHKKLNHPHVVKMMTHFEDPNNLFIILELCESSSLMELQKRRKFVSEEEARYFLGQIVDGCAYLHQLSIIHRDLKLGNLFLNHRMQVKIGDFGLATIVRFVGERRKTLCGTPNYIAPEMLKKEGHSYEVDIWALGCILYTLLIGKPPFETQSLQDTYTRIKKNQYTIPSRISEYAAKLIKCLLDPVPSQRPTVFNIQKADFFRRGYHPHSLPNSCLTTQPKFDFVNKRRSLAGEQDLCGMTGNVMSQDRSKFTAPLLVASTATSGMRDLFDLLSKLLDSYDASFQNLDDILEPSCRPVFWVSKWVDYSDRYGLGYQLSDESIGVLFNDGTKLVSDAAFKQLQYVDKAGQEVYHRTEQQPENLNKKYSLLRYFRSYMNENLVKAGANITMTEGEELQRLPVMYTWLRSRSAIMLLLNNGLLQANFFEDHEKVIVCPHLEAVTCITGKGEMFTLKIEKMMKHSYPSDLFKRLKYMRGQIQKMMEANQTLQK